MSDAITPRQVTEYKQRAHEDAIAFYVKRVSEWLYAHDAYPAGHWDVAGQVPMRYRRQVAEQFERVGWTVSYNLDNDAYADHFTIKPTPPPPVPPETKKCEHNMCRWSGGSWSCGAVPEPPERTDGTEWP